MLDNDTNMHAIKTLLSLSKKETTNVNKFWKLIGTTTKCLDVVYLLESDSMNEKNFLTTPFFINKISNRQFDKTVG